MKKVFFTVFCVLISFISVFSQDVKDENTKMDEFVSKTGVIIKFVDYSLPDLKLSYGAAETKVRKIISGGETEYFLVISKETDYGSRTASIAYEDLLEVINALNSLMMELNSDISSNPDYLENKFITDDGFQLGYYISEGKTKWYMVLEKYKSKNTIFINNYSDIKSLFDQAKQKMDNLRN